MTKRPVKINYNSTFTTQHSRDYYRGASFHYSGEWIVGAHYVSDDYNIDFVVHDQVLLACAKSHLSSTENEPIDYIKDDGGNVIGIASIYWDFVMSGIHGKSPGIKIIDNYWYTCDDTKLPPEQQIWVNTGVKASLEYEDLTPEQIAELQRPGLEVVQNFVNNVITQEEGDDPAKVMSQKVVTELLDALGLEINSKVQSGTTAYWNSKPITFIPREGDVYIYTDYETKEVGGITIDVPGIKVGSGRAPLIDLAFVGEKEKDMLLAHINDANSHITVQERDFWNNKINVDDSAEVIGETLILNRN